MNKETILIAENYSNYLKNKIEAFIRAHTGEAAVFA